MISVVLIGTGNVAQNLFHAFGKATNIEVKQVAGRTAAHLKFARDISKVTTDLDKLVPADVYILAVSDDAIPSVSSKLTHTRGLLVHTSGGTSLEALGNRRNAGVFYPLQTFTQGKAISFDDIPLCIEAKQPNDVKTLRKLGTQLSSTVVTINSEERQILHVSAVFVNNFTNYMYTIAESLCKENKVDFKILKPLIKETAAKLDHLSPLTAQTGPALRGDQQTLHTHLSLLKNKQHRDIYTLLSNAIKSKHGEEL